ncbi:3'(2'),5'-bisphosphate nucleotidase CysQ [Pontibacter anaerobius]|uniref:3'(2'),5'-bisphosphate nucleotidase CysQ n=1 Tax=Pontibacter anaerobius TaxID=2993940 RepID=A0ABT3REM2_9BACT|nr:3'(2'),5'-bisphosphate nucleotidase CysQ [Pontibacter anaerobius]MCX2739966.1 3'(2'),5'-bisphosphate nucleotidase CysQ [Pontibacter anaerobius]
MYVDLILTASIKAGEGIVSIYESAHSIDYKADNSPITEADKVGHRIINRYLNQTVYPILSEEGKNVHLSERIKWDNYWLVDPLDGTKEFINKNGEFTVNIALISAGTPVIGVVYVPVKKWLYVGIEGEGAWKLELEDHQLPPDWKSAGIKLPVDQCNNDCYTVVGSRSHTTEETNKFISNLEKKHGELSFLSMGSSLKICLVAEGKADIYPRLAPTMEWDTAAGDAIARSAGCKVVQYETGEPLQYNKKNLLNPWFVVKR